MSQKESYLKGDWLGMLMKDLDFIQEQIDEDSKEVLQMRYIGNILKTKLLKGPLNITCSLKKKQEENESS